MTARMLQSALVEDLTEFFSDDYHKTPAGGMAHLSVFPQHLPYRDTTEESEDPFPFILVVLDSGSIGSATEAHNVKIILVVGLYDDNPDNQGHVAVLEVMERIQQHYEEQPLLGQFSRDYNTPFDWQLQDEESFPFFYGAATMAWSACAPRFNSEFA